MPQLGMSNNIINYVFRGATHSTQTYNYNEDCFDIIYLDNCDVIGARSEKNNNETFILMTKSYKRRFYSQND